MFRMTCWTDLMFCDGRPWYCGPMRVWSIRIRMKRNTFIAGQRQTSLTFLMDHLLINNATIVAIDMLIVSIHDIENGKVRGGDPGLSKSCRLCDEPLFVPSFLISSSWSSDGVAWGRAQVLPCARTFPAVQKLCFVASSCVGGWGERKMHVCWD